MRGLVAVAALGVAALGWMASAPAPAAAQEAAAIVVTTESDVVDAGDGLTSLREAVDQANALVGDDTIELAEGATYSLVLCDGSVDDADVNRGGDLDHTDPTGALKIEGAGATLLGPGACSDRLLHSLGSGLLTLEDLTVRGGVIDPFEPNLDSWDGGGVLAYGDVIVRDVVIADNEAVGFYGKFGAGQGGGIAVYGTLTLVDSEVSGGLAGWGGGVSGSHVELRNSSVHDNEAIGGGGVYSQGTVELTARSRVFRNEATCGHARGASFFCGDGGGVSSPTTTVSGRSAVYENRATAPGGGINGDTVTVVDSVVRDNRSRGARGGWSSGDGTTYSLSAGGAGIHGEVITLSRSTIAGNVLDPGDGQGETEAERAIRGAGLYATDELHVDASTIAGNRAVGRSVRVGGAHSDGALEATNSTISGNTSDRGAGAGISATGAATLTHVTVARNRGRFASNLATEGPLTLDRTLIGRGKGGSACQVEGPVTSLGYNVVQLGLAGGNCGVGAGPGDQVGVPWLGLRPLAANGGPTRTHLAMAAAVQVVPVDACSVHVDQRGAPRPQGSLCEAGAVEIADRVPTG